MKNLLKSNKHITILAGIGSGVTISLIISIIIFKNLTDEGLSIENVFVIVPLYFILGSLIYSAILGGIGAISGYFLHKSISNYMKYLILLLLSILSGLIGFFSFDRSQLSKITIQNVEQLFSSHFYLFTIVFFLFQIPIYVWFLREKMK